MGRSDKILRLVCALNFTEFGDGRFNVGLVLECGALFFAFVLGKVGFLASWVGYQ